MIYKVLDLSIDEIVSGTKSRFEIEQINIRTGTVWSARHMKLEVGSLVAKRQKREVEVHASGSAGTGTVAEVKGGMEVDAVVEPSSAKTAGEEGNGVWHALGCLIFGGGGPEA